ncbi:MAG: biotin--[acetyl-CoA-carboxylase] ligase [Chloroflexi bacterium]|nr:biotin--[acetyl-CoA-carboxylase] ligase [Chloroflexota bacterium]
MPRDRLADAVRDLPAPWQGHYFDAVDSTQDKARAAARHAAPTRSVFVADYQRAGRGRSQRQWLASPGSALLVSMLFREPSATDAIRPWRYTSLVSVAVVQLLDQLGAEAKAAIKWPNDVMLADRKVAGILAETRWDGQDLEVIVGLGLNVSAVPDDLTTATCLEVVTPKPVDRGDLLLTFLSQLDALLRQPDDVVHGMWESRLWGRGQRLRLLDRGLDEEVVVLGAQRDGSLHVRGPDGRDRTITTGELLA